MNLTILKISVPKFITGLLHKRNQNVVEDQMIVTADERRNVLNLFNVSEAARQLGVVDIDPRCDPLDGVE